MEYWEGATNNHRRCIRMLKLMENRGSIEVPVLRMADADLVDFAADGMLLRGIELESHEGRISEHVQMWLVRPRSSGSEALKPLDPNAWIKKLPDA